MSYDDAPRPAPGSETGGTTPGESAGYLADLRSVGRFRVGALLATAVLTLSYVAVLRSVTQVVGGTSTLLPVVLGSVLAAAVAARYLRLRWALVLAAAALVGGYVYYLLVVPQGVTLLLERGGKLVSDAVALLTGLQIVQVTRADVWAVGYAPGPVFLSWYLAFRRRYLWGALVGGVALFMLVLTGDAGALTTLVGVLGGTAAVGLGELDRRGGTLLQADALIMLVAVVAVLAPLVSLVPGTPVDPLRLGLGDTTSVEGTFVGSQGEMRVVGSIELSAEERFRVDAEEARYWRTGVYDRFTGGSWVRTGQSSPYGGDLSTPPGERRELVQTVETLSEVGTMPAANQPVSLSIEGDPGQIARVTDQNTLAPQGTLIEGDSYRVRSLVPNATPAELRRTGTDYPGGLREAYTQLPASTSDRLRQRAANVTADAGTPYDAAVRVERHLERTKEYSRTVDRPPGNIADGFLFEMDAGYCTYFATTMVAMLRAEGVPARVATGYTPGEPTEDGYLVRGLDAHVWVEVYFPDQGWVRFDPTPAEERRAAEQQAIERATGGGGAGGGADDTERVRPDDVRGVGDQQTIAPPTSTVDDEDDVPASLPSEGLPGGGPTTPAPANGTESTTVGSGGDGSGGGVPALPTPSRRQLAFGAVSLVGLVAGAHRAGVGRRVGRAVRLRYQSRREPREDVLRAVDRLELLLGERYHPRDPDETRREYVAALEAFDLDERARRVYDLHERARHAGEVDREAADEAVRLVDAMVGETTPVIGRVRRRLQR